MVHFEVDPKLARQGAAAMLCVAATAAAMPLVAARGAEQREDSWAARAAQFQDSLAANGGSAVVQLAGFTGGPGGFSARGVGLLDPDVLKRQAILIGAEFKSSLSITPLDPIEPGAMGRVIRSLREQHCLALAVYYEARGESYEGQIAVAEVVRNRVKSKHWPDSFCGVVYEGSTRSTGCQFTFTCDGSLKARPRGPAWRQAQAVAGQVYGGVAKPITGMATHYHTTAVDPYWNDSLVETRRIGSHIFYRLPSRRERIDLQAGLRGRLDEGLA
jgi:hypothetical protein